MHSTLIIVGIVLVVGIGLVFYKYSHRTGLHNNVEQLKKVIELTFAEAGKEEITQNRLIKGMKQHLGINEKMALKLIGKSRFEHLIERVPGEMKEFGKVLYKKAF